MWSPVEEWLPLLVPEMGTLTAHLCFALTSCHRHERTDESAAINLLCWSVRFYNSILLAMCRGKRLYVCRIWYPILAWIGTNYKWQLEISLYGFFLIVSGLNCTNTLKVSLKPWLNLKVSHSDGNGLSASASLMFITLNCKINLGYKNQYLIDTILIICLVMNVKSLATRI
jgi:hypothetical protein